jgi:hypothetical protein
MTQEPLAKRGNFLHIYDFRVRAGHEEEFIRLFDEFDYSDGNPMHKSSAQSPTRISLRTSQSPREQHHGGGVEECCGRSQGALEVLG